MLSFSICSKCKHFHAGELVYWGCQITCGGWGGLCECLDGKAEIPDGCPFWLEHLLATQKIQEKKHKSYCAECYNKHDAK